MIMKNDEEKISVIDDEEEENLNDGSDQLDQNSQN